MNDEPHHRHGAFFGRRKGHPLRARQAELFGSLLPRLALDLTAPRAGQSRTACFPSRSMTCALEIGFGGAEHLIAQAQAHPRTGFIGCEPFVNGMAKALVAIDEHNLTNVRLHHGDAVDLLAGCRRTRSRASICSIPIRGRSGATGSGASSTTKTSRRSRASCGRAENSASRPTGRITPSGRCCGCSRVARFHAGPPSAPTTGASLGRDSPARAMRRRRSAKAARRPISSSAAT